MKLSAVLLLVAVGLQMAGQARAEQSEAFKAYKAGDHARAYALWIEEARAGDAVAQNNVGHLLLEGLGVAKDEHEACRWFLAANQSGALTKASKINAAWLLDQGQCQDGSPDLAVSLLTEAMNRHEPDKNDEVIVGLLTRHANRDHAEAQYQLAQLYKSGERIDKDEKLAFRWCQKAAVRHVEAHILLGEMYLRGTGVKKNVGKAEDLLLKSALRTATQRDKRLLAELHCYEKKDYVRARVWLGLSEHIRHKDKDAAEPLLGFFVDMVTDTETGDSSAEDRSRIGMETEIENKLTTAQKTRADKLLDHWRSAYDRGLPGVDVARLESLSVP